MLKNMDKVMDKNRESSHLFFNKNLKYLRRNNNRQTQESLANELGLTRSVISSYEDGRAEPSISTLTKISDYFSVSIENLSNLDLANVDEKEVEFKRELEKYASGKNFEVKTITIRDPKQRFINLVPQKASAGYSSGFSNEELSELPNYQLPFLTKNKEYRAFEIKGDSMLPLPDKSIVIAEWVENVSDIVDGQKYIIVTEDEGVVFKEVYNKIEDRNSLLLKSSNIIYSPYEISATSVSEIWSFVAFISKNFPQEFDPSDGLKEAFSRMEHEIQEIKMSHA